MALAAPSGLVATVISSRRIDLTWENAENTSYNQIRVYRKEGAGVGEGDLYAVIAGSKESWEDVSCIAETQYFYAIKGRKLHPYVQTSDFSNEVDGTTFAAIETPTGIVATPISDTEIDIIFNDKSTLEDVHRLERKLGAGAYGLVVDLEPNRDFYRDTGLVKGSLYTYRVRAEAIGSDDTDWDESAQVTTIEEPSDPTNLVISEVKDKSMLLTWTDNSDDETGFKVEISDDGNFAGEEVIKVIGANITEFLVTGLDVNTQYWFRVCAYNAAGDSGYTTEEDDTTLATYVPTEFEKWIRTPNIKPIYLAEIYTKMTLTGFAVHDDPCYKVTIGASDRGIDILEVFEDSEAYTEQASAADVKSNAESFYFDYNARILYVHATGGVDPAGFLIEGAFWLYFSTHKDIEFTANGRLNYFLPFLSKGDIPSLSQEIKSYFEGNFSISSGAIAFKNDELTSKKFFDKKFETYTWLSSKIILKAGEEEFTYAQFKEVFTAYIDNKSCNDRKITFQLLGMQKKMEGNISLSKFDIEVYPGMVDEDGTEDRFVGKPIPIGFGFNELVVPVAVDIANGKFKFNDTSASVRSKSVDEVRRNKAVLVEDTHYYVDLQRSIITFSRDGAFIIVAGKNDKIDFKEGDGGELNVTLDPGTYTTAELRAEIKSKMEAVNSLIFTVTCSADPRKFTIAADGEFSLLWKTGTNGADGTDTHVGSLIGYYDDEDDDSEDSYEADEDVITPTRHDIMEVTFTGFVNSADEVLENGAEIFKYLLNNYKELEDLRLNLDGIYESKYANENELSIYIDKEVPFNEIIRTIEHSIEAYAFQDEFGRLGIRPQQIVVASNAKYIVSEHTFAHSQSKGRSVLFWKVVVRYNKNRQTDTWESKEATDDEIYWKYDTKEELEIDTYFRDPAYAESLAISILDLVNKATVNSELPMLLFDVLAGNLVVFSRKRFFATSGTADEITLRVIKISKMPNSGKTTIVAEEV